MNPSDRLIVALDVPTLGEAEGLVKTLSPVVQIFKIGKELFTAEGPRAVGMVRSHGGHVFLDLKFHDIPNTVASACGAAVKLGVWMLNVHALGGRPMLEAAARAVKKAAGELKVQKPFLLGVTVLTSISEKDLQEVGIGEKVDAEVERLARLAEACGLNGVVASPQEIENVREACGRDFQIVTPGVRPPWAESSDQKRVMTPSAAIRLGANFIVVGRPITKAKDPLQAAKKILEEIS